MPWQSQRGEEHAVTAHVLLESPVTCLKTLRSFMGYGAWLGGACFWLEACLAFEGSSNNGLLSSHGCLLWRTFMTSQCVL